MIKINQTFEQVYEPKKALLVYESVSADNFYIEAFDIGNNGKPLNAHPLSVSESITLAKSLANTAELSNTFLQSRNLLPENLLYTSAGMEGFAIWFTPPQKVGLRFIETLGIPCGSVAVPAMIWKANKSSLSVYAVKSTKKLKPDANQKLYHAPFFNVYESGKVCMGTVEIKIEEECGLEDFMELWQAYFYNSYFSHTMHGHVPVKGNIVQLWQELYKTGKAFPVEHLIATSLKIKDLL
ncbi:PRTRC system protein B [Pedobacter sp. GR22-10]|uniref:PRTRC system protein B n=1 Tax=Pedobacter sp. GR22-10 TaxID=2994472 RepID=UPI0022452086|nr:PRTRC system protein B [Pedobacter sp. GR22-10]MCX2429866.1 PRTRC system protein B [Pedobacter sp. GR22-10]